MYFFLILFSFIVLLIYTIVILSFYIAWQKYPAFENSPIVADLFVTVIIPARNEELKIPDILADLTKQDFNFSSFEVLVINDHSEDNTVLFAEKFMNSLSNLVVIDLPERFYGKKQAISFAIGRAKGELVITLDADCRIGTKWLSAISSFYNRYHPKLIIGPLLYGNGKKIFEHMQFYEIAGLVASGAGASIIGHPIMCNGANLAFTREIYLESSSKMNYESPSGDDLFLLLTVKQKWPEGIMFLKSADAVVYTHAASGLKNFIQQRNRWTSKAKFYKDRDIILTASLIFIFNFTVVSTLIVAISTPWFYLWFLSLIILKSIADLLLLNSFISFFEKKIVLKYFWLTQLLYPFYIVFMSIYGNIGKFRWKNRTYL
jgi:poly-beta-1,6-N-acetyl-D-glucosamine synthase